MENEKDLLNQALIDLMVAVKKNNDLIEENTRLKKELEEQIHEKLKREISNGRS